MCKKIKFFKTHPFPTSCIYHCDPDVHAIKEREKAQWPSHVPGKIALGTTEYGQALLCHFRVQVLHLKNKQTTRWKISNCYTELIPVSIESIWTLTSEYTLHVFISVYICNSRSTTNSTALCPWITRNTRTLLKAQSKSFILHLLAIDNNKAE